MTEKQFKEITQWQNKTFPTATALSSATHLKDEIAELMEAIKLGNRFEINHEIADCFILLFNIADKCSLSHMSLKAIIDEKMAINYARTWNKPDERGVVKHVKE